MIRSYTYSAEEYGPRLLVLGAVHGNEVCGTQAIRRVMDDFETGKLKLKKGHVEFVPIANPRAHEAGQRFIERNLNRFFIKTQKPEAYEAKLTNVLSIMIEACNYFIDLHSTTAGGIPFASVEGKDIEEHALAEAMGAEVLLFGWEQAYEASGRTNPDPNESLGTTAYARRHGAKACLLECGQHKDPQSIEVAYRAIRGAMRHIGLVDDDLKVPQPKVLTLKVSRVVFKKEGGSFAENWGNFSPVTKGQLLSTFADGEAVRAPADGFIILPNPNTPPDTEWFYFGEAM